MHPPEAKTGSAIKAATFSDPSSLILSSNSLTRKSQNCSGVWSSDLL
jgi:hypothetical protein